MGSGPEATAEALREEGNRLYRDGRFEQAATCYHNALALSPPSGHIIRCNLSTTYIQLGRLDEALEEAQIAVQARPDWAKSWLRKAQALQRLGRPGHAERAVKEGLMHCPDDEGLKLELQDILKVGGDGSSTGMKHRTDHSAMVMV
jgi:tetratricopeptide (TPR) repeat protein